MQRRTFIRNSGLTAGAALALPTLGSALNLFDKPVNQKAKHVVYCILGGGVRLNETIEQQFGYLMPNLLHSRNSSSRELDLGFEWLPTVLSKPLLASATLYTNFNYAAGPINHFNAALAVLCGKYFQQSLDYRSVLSENSVFDYYN
ncbi:MAG: hypothetical protein ACK5B6_11350, partial [Bacteroidia bacterium]